MSATIRRPACSRPGSMTSPAFGRASVMVTSARTQGVSACPVVAFTPEGMSIATIGFSERSAHSMAAAMAPRGAPLLPVPRSASTRNEAEPAASSASLPSPQARGSGRNVTGMRAFSQAWWFTRASVERSPSDAATSRRTPNPADFRWRATTNPSPPLLPRPQRITTEPPPVKRRTAAAAPATAPARFGAAAGAGPAEGVSSLRSRHQEKIAFAVSAPARSINFSDGTAARPHAPWIVARSSAAISSAVTMRC